MVIRILLVVVALVGATQPAAPWQPLFERVQPDLFAAPGGQASAWADDRAAATVRRRHTVTLGRARHMEGTVP